MIKFRSLNQNKEFLKILKKKKFTIYFDRKIDIEKNSKNKILNISFVAKKKIGNAVKRNKIKRKLKSAVRKILTENKQIEI